MPAPFYNAIKSTTTGTPGTAAFTPNAAAAGYRDWSNVPSGWIGLVRFVEGAAWELSWSYWNGATLSRSAAQLFDSSTGSRLVLTAAATAAMIEDASDVMSHVGTTPWRGWFAVPNSSTMTSIGMGNNTTAGTAAAVAIAATNFLTKQPRIQYTSLTTPANSQTGPYTATPVALVDTTAGHGGYEFICRCGASALPTGPRMFIGMTGATFNGNTAEPSAFVANYAVFGKDSGDTNIQLLVNSGAGGGTKTDTGIPWVANGWYEMAIWTEPGSTKVYALLIRVDTGDIWFGTTTVDVPVNGTLMMPQVFTGLSATTGTALVLHVGSVTIRSGT